jgi:hypothetical protein
MDSDTTCMIKACQGSNFRLYNSCLYSPAEISWPGGQSQMTRHLMSTRNNVNCVNGAPSAAPTSENGRI